MMRKIFLILSLAFAIVMLPCVSLADDDGFSGSDGGSFSNSAGGVVYSKYGDNDTYKVYVKAPNRWQAAVYACGGDPSLLSSEIRSKLSDPRYGGDFYAYAQTFEPMDNFFELPIWVLFGSVDGSDHISEYMESEVSNSFYNSALVDYKRVLAGDDLSGGGSGGGDVGDYHLFSVSAFANTLSNVDSYNRYYWDLTNASFSDGELVVGSGVTRVSPYSQSRYYFPVGRMYVNLSTLQLADEYINQGYDVIFYFDLGSSLQGFVYGRNLAIERVAASNIANHYVNVIMGEDRHWCSLSSSFYFSDVPFSVLAFSDAPSFESVTGTFAVTYYSDVFDTPFDVVAPPDGVWPEPITPVTPDPPEVPTPTAPTETVDPEPTAPTIIWPTSPTLVLPTSPIVSTTPEGIDYTALLTLINDNLNSIDAYLQNFYTSFNSFRSDFLSGIDDIVDGLRNIYQYLGHLNNILEVHCKHITDQIEESVYNLELYIKRLFEWLPKQLNFDAEFDYDDSAVTTLLRRILNKIPGGSTGTPVSYKPNPQSDTPGFFDWLADLWHRFLLDLVSVLPDALGGLVDDISQLTHYFPFSIPWDMFALLALFAHEPVTPVFDVPWGYGGDEGEIQMIRVDLSAWDGVMETVRPVFLVGFCMQLAMITKDLLANFDLKQGGV